MEYTLSKLMGGVANGKDVPSDWDGISEWVEPGTGAKSIYEKRHFYYGGDRFDVWVAADVPEPDFLAIMWWHREMYRGDLVAAQKSLLHESISAATNYSNVILVVGYAGLFALLAQFSGTGSGKFTPATSFFAAIFLALSAMLFVGWEIFGMTLRSYANIKIAQSLNQPSQFEARIKAYRERMETFARRFVPYWVAVLAGAVIFAVISFGIMLSAMLHGAWQALLHC